MCSCARHRGKTPIACSLEPCMNMRATITFLPDRDKRKKRTEAACVACDSLHRCLSTRRLNTKLRVLCSSCFAFCKLSRPPNKGKSASASLTTDIAIACSTAVETKDNETKGQNLLALPATCKNLQHRRSRTKRPAVLAQHTNRRTCLVSIQKLCSANKCNGKPRQHRDVKGSVNSCSLSLRRCKTKPSHTLARRASKLNLYLIGHFTTLCFAERAPLTR